MKFSDRNCRMLRVPATFAVLTSFSVSHHQRDALSHMQRRYEAAYLEIKCCAGSTKGTEMRQAKAHSPRRPRSRARAAVPAA